MITFARLLVQMKDWNFSSGILQRWKYFYFNANYWSLKGLISNAKHWIPWNLNIRLYFFRFQSNLLVCYSKRMFLRKIPRIRWKGALFWYFRTLSLQKYFKALQKKTRTCIFDLRSTVRSSELDTLLMRYEVNLIPYRIKSVSNSLDQTVQCTYSNIKDRPQFMSKK